MQSKDAKPPNGANATQGAGGKQPQADAERSPTDFYSTTLQGNYQAFFGGFDKKISFRAKKFSLPPQRGGYNIGKR